MTTETETVLYTTRFRKAYQLIEWKRYDAALKEAGELVRENPDDADVYALVGDIHLKLDQYDKALHWSGEALKRDPENQVAWYVRVAVYYETGNDKALDEALQEARRIDPYEAQYLFIESNMCNKKGRFAEAKAHIEDALALRPENPLYIAMLSYIEALLNNSEASRALSQEALRLEAESPYVFLHLAWAAGRRDEYALQADYLKSAIRLQPDNSQIRAEYLEALQKNYMLYRFFLFPAKLMKRWKPWQFLLVWFAAWIIFKPLVIVFILLYILSHWLTKLLVHVKVFGWTFKK